MGKINIAKTPPNDFKVITPENSLLSQQAVTSKGIPVLYTNLQLNPYPNTQLDLFYSDNLSFQCTAPNMWLTNSMRGSQYAAYTPTWERCWLQNSSVHTLWRSWSSLVTKPYGVQTQKLLEEKDELGHMSLVHNMLRKNFCIDVHQLWQPLKQSLYMFRDVRKKSPNIYTRIGWKSELKNWFS